METIALRPHHLLDVVTDFEFDDDPDCEPAPGENGVRALIRLVGANLDRPVRFVVGPDFVCEPCSHLQPDGRCDRILEHHDPPEPMDDYNDPLDRRILEALGIAPGTEMSIREFLEMINDRMPGFERICTHPGRTRADRREGLIRGLTALGVRSEAESDGPAPQAYQVE